MAAGSTTSLASRPLPPRHPPYPTSPPGEHLTKKQRREAIHEWRNGGVTGSESCTNKNKLKLILLNGIELLVDGKLLRQFTGVVFDWDEANKRGKILTTSSVVCDFNGELHEPTLKLSVRLPNKTITEGQLLFFNVNYGFALLEVIGDIQLQVPSYASSTNYGQDVFALARDENMSLMVRHGTISWLDYPVLFNYSMFVSCGIPEGGSGGLVSDHDGNIIGIAFDIHLGSVVTSISTIRTCIEMWHKFSRVGRPIAGMQLKAVELLDVSTQEELCLDYNITGGFIVNQVYEDSTAERLGIRRGDVIVFQDNSCSTVPQLEEYLLSLGWVYLQGISLTADLKVEVHNLVDSYKECITFPVQFSDSSKRVYG
uniref:PDZ domain-containing protein n=1 Tax=Leersia perrieri TaxID=77586 RepID=A0A0D9X4B7_9ORYZ